MKLAAWAMMEKRVRISEEIGGGMKLVIKEWEIKLTRETQGCKDTTMYTHLTCVTIKSEVKPVDSVFL